MMWLRRVMIGLTAALVLVGSAAAKDWFEGLASDVVVDDQPGVLPPADRVVDNAAGPSRFDNADRAYCGPNYTRCYEDCDDRFGPCWTIKADAVIMKRERPKQVPLLLDASNDPVFNASDLHFDFEAGPQVSITRHFDRGFDLEATYFGIDAWNASRVDGNLPGVTHLNTIDTLYIAPGVDVSTTYRSRLHSLEINLRRPSRLFGWLTWLVGFRLVELHEDLEMQFEFFGQSALYHARTRNYMYGLQVGTDMAIWDRGGPLRIDGLVKVAAYDDDARHRSAVDQPPGYTFAGPINTGDDFMAFTGELGIVGKYQLTDCIALRAGYQLLWVEGVALASNQMPASNLSAGTGIDTSGSPFYHGGLVGLEITR